MGAERASCLPEGAPGPPSSASQSFSPYTRSPRGLKGSSIPLQPWERGRWATRTAKKHEGCPGCASRASSISAPMLQSHPSAASSSGDPFPSTAPAAPAQPCQQCPWRLLGLSQCLGRQSLIPPSIHSPAQSLISGLAPATHPPQQRPGKSSPELQVQPRAAPSARLFPMLCLTLAPCTEGALSPHHLPKRGEEQRQLWDAPGATALPCRRESDTNKTPNMPL